MPRLPQNLHVVTIWRSPDNAIRKNTQHDTSAVLCLPREMTEVSKVLPLPRKMLKTTQKYTKVRPLPHKTTFDTLWNMLECHKAPCLPHETRLEPPKVTTVAELAIGTAIRPYIRADPGGCERFRTVPNGSERFRTVARCRAHASTPKPPVKREPLLRIREKGPVISGDAFSWQLWAWHSLSLQQSLNFVSSAARPLGTKIGKTDLWFQDVESNWNGSQGNKFNLCSSWFILCSSCFDSFLFFSLFFLVELNGQSRFHRKRTHRQHERSTRCPNTTQVAKLLWHTVRLTKDLWFLRTRVRHAESCWVMLLGKHQAAREKTQCMSRSFKIANAICQIVVGLWEFFAKLARAPILLVTRASQVLMLHKTMTGDTDSGKSLWNTHPGPRRSSPPLTQWSAMN